MSLLHFQSGKLPTQFYTEKYCFICKLRLVLRLSNIAHKMENLSRFCTKKIKIIMIPSNFLIWFNSYHFRCESISRFPQCMIVREWVIKWTGSHFPLPLYVLYVFICLVFFNPHICKYLSSWSKYRLMHIIIVCGHSCWKMPVWIGQWLQIWVFIGSKRQRIHLHLLVNKTIEQS